MEKPSVEKLENDIEQTSLSGHGMPPDVVELFARFDKQRQKQLTRKMDLHLIPCVGFP